MTELEQPPQNGIDLSAAEYEENSKARPADIEQDMREMERRKRVEAIMGSKLFREELERIVDCARDSGNEAGILQQLSDIVGLPSSRIGSVFKTSTCMLPINDIRGVESMGYAKGEKILRCKLAATFRLLDLYGWTQGLGAQITARLKVDQEYFLVNPYGLLHHEITASSLNKVDMQGNIVEQGTTNFGVNKTHFVLHSVVHAARPDIRCAIYVGCTPVAAISSLKTGLLPLTKDACVLGELSTYSYMGYLNDEEERNKLVRNLGPNSKVMLLTNHGALCCGETIEEAFFAACHIVQACETQLKLLPVGLDNIVLIPEESRKIIYDQSRRPPEDLEKKFATAAIADSNKSEEDKKADVDNSTKIIGQVPKWRVGGAEFEALMRMLDNAGYRTGYIYRHPLIKSEPPKPKNDVELPPAVSSLGYLLEEEELFRQGIWKKGDMRKGGDRSRWLNSPNVYQKVEVLETGTPDPKKITKWVAEGSPTHSTPVRIDDPLQFVPVNTNPKEFKRVQQQIKDNRRADKISAGPQSHILEGVTWDEANRIKDATVSSAGDHVVLMGAASKGIIQRGFQHNATVYKAPYAKNPFDNVTDDELNEYKRTVERKKKSIHGEYTDTDFSESEGLSSLQTSGAQQTKQTTSTTRTAAVSQSEPEDISEHQVMRIQTEQAPVPSQPEVVLSDDVPFFLNVSQEPQDPKIHRSLNLTCHSSSINQHQSITECGEEGIYFTDNQENCCNVHGRNKHNSMLIKQLEQNVLFKKLRHKTHSHTYSYTQEHSYEDQGNGNLLNFSEYDSSTYQQLSKDENDFYDSSYLSRNAHRSDRDHSIHYGEIFYSRDKYLRLLRKNLKICCTPNVCDKIFESLLKSKSSTNQRTMKNCKILNIPLPRCNAKTEKSWYAESNLPYRTVSHFGFNKPMQEPQLNHKHLANKTDESPKYVPLTRSESYEEIFSSTRYLNLCECCFEFIVRLKPELMKGKPKLHNLFENTDSCLKLSSGIKYFTDTTANNNFSSLSHDDGEPFSIFSLHLNNNEDESVSNKDFDNSTIRNSTFNDQIAKINSESSNFKKSDHLNTVNSKDDAVGFAYYENAICSDKNEVNGSNDTFVKVLQKEKNSKKLVSGDDRPRRKLEFQESLNDSINLVDHIENDFLCYNNAKLEKQNKQNVIDVSIDMWNEHKRLAHSLTNNQVEEFKSTLSRICFSPEHQDIGEYMTIKRKDFKTSANNGHTLKNLNPESDPSDTDNSNDSSQVVNIPENPTALTNLDNSFGLVNNESNKDNFSILERTILEKIHINDLNKSDKIFEKIENTIRNKITPFQLELKIKEQAALLQGENNTNEKENILSKSLNAFNTRSLSSFKRNSSKGVVSKLQKKSHLTSPQKNTTNNKERRNFILENIRSVSVPRKRNANNKFEKKPYFTSPRIIEHKGLKSNPNLVSTRSSSSSTVYSFQSKLVRGSPRFWISMTQSLAKEQPQPVPPACIRKLSTSTEKHKPNGVNSSSLAMMPSVETKIVNNVDAEIDALGDEIQQIQPRLENYERKIDDFSHRIANCVNNINDCVTTQENIMNVQKKMQDCIKLREYTEEIMCRVQTFSLSETED